jgi:hypothetical protein
MGVLPVLPQGKNTQVCLANGDLPDFYMSDYSVLGLEVINLERTYRVLADKNFAVARKSEHLEVSIQNAAQMSEIVNLLNQSGIDCSITDIIDQVYQG